MNAVPLERLAGEPARLAQLRFADLPAVLRGLRLARPCDRELPPRLLRALPVPSATPSARYLPLLERPIHDLVEHQADVVLWETIQVLLPCEPHAPPPEHSLSLG